jgi:hypothetical protein
MRFLYVLTFFLNALLIGYTSCAPTKTNEITNSKSSHSLPKHNSKPYTAEDHIQSLRTSRKEMERCGRKWQGSTILAGWSQSFCLFGDGGHFRHHTSEADAHDKAITREGKQLSNTLKRTDFQPPKDAKEKKKLDHELHWAKKRIEQYPSDKAHRSKVRADHQHQDDIDRGRVPHPLDRSDSDDILFS